MNSYDEQLLFAVSQQPVLFNPMRYDYKSPDAKMEAWQEVMKMLNTSESIERIRQRWKSIRDTYVKYLNKKNKTSSGSKLRPYKYEKNLKFLKPFLASIPDASLSPEEYSVVDEPFVSVSHLPDDDQSSTSSGSSRKRKQTDAAEENNFSESLNNESCKLLQHMDEVDIFFLALAQTIKRLKPLTSAKLKKQIANIVSDAEIKELEETE